MSMAVIFAACEMRSCVNVSIMDDDDVLGDIESFNVTLENTTDLDSSIILDPVNGIIVIIDNDGRYIINDVIAHTDDTRYTNVK